MNENTIRLKRKIKIISFIWLLFSIFVGYAGFMWYSIYTAKIEKLTADNRMLLGLVENQTTQIERLRNLGWSDSKIDKYVESGCLMYIEVGGSK